MAQGIDAAVKNLNAAKAGLADAIGQAHIECAHTVWVERPTYSVADWLSPHSAIRICKNCRAEIQDRGIYREWLSHGEYSYNKPDKVELVLQPAQAGVSEIFALRLNSDPRPFFKDFDAVLAWKPPPHELAQSITSHIQALP